MGKYDYQKLHMGIFGSPNVFQEKNYELFKGFYIVHAYIYDVLIITKNDFVGHLKALEKVLQKIAETGLKVNTQNIF